MEISESLKNGGSSKYELAYRVGPEAGYNESRPTLYYLLKKYPHGGDQQAFGRELEPIFEGFAVEQGVGEQAFYSQEAEPFLCPSTQFEN